MKNWSLTINFYYAQNLNQMNPELNRKSSHDKKGYKFAKKFF